MRMSIVTGTILLAIVAACGVSHPDPDPPIAPQKRIVLDVAKFDQLTAEEQVLLSSLNQQIHDGVSDSIRPCMKQWLEGGGRGGQRIVGISFVFSDENGGFVVDDATFTTKDAVDKDYEACVGQAIARVRPSIDFVPLGLAGGLNLRDALKLRAGDRVGTFYPVQAGCASPDQSDDAVANGLGSINVKPGSVQPQGLNCSKETIQITGEGRQYCSCEEVAYGYCVCGNPGGPPPCSNIGSCGIGGCF